MTAAISPLTTADLATVTQLARQLRVDSIRASTRAGSGHPTSSMSAADLLAVLGSAVVAALRKAGVQQLRLAHLSVSELPGSGTTAELLAGAGIDATHIASAAAVLIDDC